MKSEWSQEILNLGSVLERWGVWTLPEKSETSHLESHPGESGVQGEVVCASHFSNSASD